MSGWALTALKNIRPRTKHHQPTTKKQLWENFTYRTEILSAKCESLLKCLQKSSTKNGEENWQPMYSSVQQRTVANKLNKKNVTNITHE